MIRRAWLSGFLVVLCLATLWAIWRQQGELAVLHDEQQLLLAQPAASADGSAAAGMTETPDTNSPTPQPPLVATPELLRLRSEVTRLTERRNELAGVRAENEGLRAQLASHGTNAPAGLKLPPGYIRKGEARFVGYRTPDDTLQSLLWALQNRDLTNVLQAFAPDRAEILRAQAGQSPQSTEDFFSRAAAFIGMRIISREPKASDDSIAVEVEVVPGESGQRISFRQFDGQWRIAGAF